MPGGGQVAMDLDNVGKLLFGRSLRLRVAAWILGRGLEAPFFQAEAAAGVMYSASAVASELDRFIELGMLSKFDDEGSSRRLYYLCNKGNPLWSAVQAAVDAVHRLDPVDEVPTA